MSGSIQIEELNVGMLRLRGAAKAIDVGQLAIEIKAVKKSLKQLRGLLEDGTRPHCSTVLPGGVLTRADSSAPLAVRLPLPPLISLPGPKPPELEPPGMIQE